MSNHRAVQCIETGVVYASIREAAKAVGLASPSNIIQCCRGSDKKIAAGFHWTYIDYPVRPPTISIKRVGARWGVYYGDTLLKTFKWHEFAEVYALDSAIWDVKERRLWSSPPVILAQSKAIRHLETGMIYPSVKDAAKELGLSPSCVGAVARGEQDSTKGQHFEYVED